MLTWSNLALYEKKKNKYYPQIISQCFLLVLLGFGFLILLFNSLVSYT